MKSLIGKIAVFFVTLLPIAPALATDGIVFGCTDSNASNYNSYANTNNNTCEYVIETNATRKNSSSEEKSLFKTAIKIAFLCLPIFIGVAIVKSIINGKK